MLAVLQRDIAAGVPFLPRLELHVEEEVSVGVAHGRLLAVLQPVHHGAVEIPVRVRRAQLAPLLVPDRTQFATLQQALGAHLEDIGEVRMELQLEYHVDRLAAVVGEVEVLVDALADGALDGEAERVGGDVGLDGVDRRIGEMDARGVEADLAQS